MHNFKGLFGNTPAPNSLTGASGADPNATAPRIWNHRALRPSTQICGASLSGIHETEKYGATVIYVPLPPISGRIVTRCYFSHLLHLSPEQFPSSRTLEALPRLLFHDSCPLPQNRGRRRPKRRTRHRNRSANRAAARPTAMRSHACAAAESRPCAAESSTIFPPLPGPRHHDLAPLPEPMRS